MRALSAADSLELRERGEALHAIDRALLLLQRADASSDADALARLPLGARDARLLAARRRLMGDRLDVEVRCPACGDRLELSLECGTLIAGASPPPTQWTVEVDGYQVSVRPLDSRDAAAAAVCREVEEAEDVLLDRSIVHATRGELRVDRDALPETVRSAVAASLASHDPGAEWLLDLACPSCNHRWQSVLDVADFVWREVVARADRILGEVHVLARTYGWSERDILDLPPARRAAYLAMIGS